MFKVIIAGSRKFDDYELLKRSCDYYLKNITDEICIVSGKAAGADTLGEKYAKERGYSIKEFPADWNNFDEPSVIKINKYGKKYNALAGHNRNEKMAEYADGLIAYYTDGSKGTKNMIEKAEKHNLLVRVINF